MRVMIDTNVMISAILFPKGMAVFCACYCICSV